MDDIHSTFDELQKTLNVRKSVLLMELEVNYGLKHKVRLQPGRTSTGGLVPGLPDASSLGSNSSKADSNGFSSVAVVW